ncbi:MAG TPA: hypothetical protein VFN71_15110 [Methylomirabilota bacterium]|nr:hypothetical protein [Methylomirabilota bacterium]
MARGAHRKAPTAVCIESGQRRVFASALAWPGWCRSGKDEQQALQALAAAAPRYALVAAEAGVAFPSNPHQEFDVVERLPGSGATDFGVPGAVAKRETEAVPRQEAERLAALLAASWTVFDRVVAGAPAELRKGPRGGGRDRDAIVAHVLGAEAHYARTLGIRLPEPAAEDATAVSSLRSAIVEALSAASSGKPVVEKGWPPRYAARRIAWHVLDHAWEIEDRSDPAG